MQQEFIFEDKVYRIRSQLDLNSPNEEPILFRDLNSAQAFFRSVVKNRFACEDLLEATKWLGISNPGACNIKTQQTAQATLEQLCLKIWAGDFLLVEVKPIPVIKFQECCIKTIKAINIMLESSNVLDKALLVSKLVILFFPGPKSSKTGELVSQINKIFEYGPGSPGTDDWMVLAKAILAVPKIARARVREVSGEEVARHEVDNKPDLRMFWERVYDSFE